MYELRLRTTTSPIHSLIDGIDREQLRLPEIQRDYVWKPAQIAGLLDSLYRQYPSGSLLLWETDEEITERHAKIDHSGVGPLIGRAQYLLDGQQRLTSLHRVFHDHPNAQVVFNIETGRFQIQSAATAKDQRWLLVHSILTQPDLYAMVEGLAEKIPGLEKNAVAKRLAKVQQIGEYKYYVEIVENMPYEEVTEIFIRVNSRGRALKTTDLALATLSARWRGVIEQLEGERQRWNAAYPAIDLAFLARSLAAVATEQRALSGFASAPQEQLKDGWQLVRRGLNHLIPLLQKNVGIETSQLVPSMNALVPLVGYLGARRDEPLGEEEANGLIYWLLGAFLTGRYNQAADTKIAQDAQAVRSPEPLIALHQNLGLLGGRLEVTEQALAGRGAGSPYFLLSYLASRRAGATDWFFGTRIGLDATGAQAIEYHHIHPQATLRKRYSKSEINDLANLAFISSRANKRISNRSPAKYFPEVGELELKRHFVPLAPYLRTVDSYPEFIRERRRQLAAGMTAFLDAFRPTAMETERTVEPSQNRLVVTVYGAAEASPEEREVEFVAVREADTWAGITTLAALQSFLADVQDGLTGGLELAGETVTVEGGADILEVPIGPFVVSGTPDEWQAMLARELDQAVGHGNGQSRASTAWVGDRVPILVAEAE